MSIYKINGTVLSTAQVESLTRSDVSLGIDIISFSMPIALSDSPVGFSYGQAVTITKDATPWFSGRVVLPRRRLKGAAKTVFLTVAGPGWWLENMAYQQLTPTGPDTAVLSKLKGRIDIDEGTPATAVITAVLTYAAAASGGDFQVGAISVPNALPADQLKDVTCADVIKACLRLAPDAVSWFDYSTAPPTIYLKNSGLSTVAIPLAALDLTSIDLTPRHDLVIPGVQFIYEIAGSVDGQAFTDIELDNAGAVNDPRCLVVTLPVTGSSRTYLKQKVRTETIRDAAVTGTGANYLQQLAYLKTHVPWLTRCQDILIGNDAPGTETSTSNHPAPARRLAYPVPGQTYELADPTDPESAHIALDVSLSRELVEGSIAEWMTTIKGQAQDIIYWLKYQRNDGSISSPKWVQVDWQQVWIHVLATNAITRTYLAIESYSAGDHVTPGAAADYLASVGELQHSGSLEITEPEFSHTLHPGCQILIPDHAEYAHMNARVQTLSYDLKTRRTSITVGPPEQLAAQSFQERMRALRPVQNGRVPQADRAVPGKEEN